LTTKVQISAIIKKFKVKWLLCAPFALTLISSLFCPQGVFVFRIVFSINSDYLQTKN